MRKGKKKSIYWTFQNHEKNVIFCLNKTYFQTSKKLKSTLDSESNAL